MFSNINNLTTESIMTKSTAVENGTKKYTTYTLPEDAVLEFGPENIIFRAERPDTNGNGSYPEELSFRGAKLEGRPVILTLASTSAQSWDGWMEATAEHQATKARIRVLKGSEVRSYEKYDTVALTLGTWRFGVAEIEIDLNRDWDDV